MKKLLTLAVLAIFALPSTGCNALLYHVTVPGPDGNMHTIIPLEGSMLIRVYNRCSPILIANGFDHQVVLPFGGSDVVILPVTWSSSRYDDQDVVYDAITADHRELGTKRESYRSSWNSAVTQKQLVVGGRDADVRISGVCG